MDPLSQLIALPEPMRRSMGLTHTPREIAQQPTTWLRTFERLESLRSAIESGCGEFGLPPRSEDVSQVILTGAGSSDYIGRALAGMLQQRWRCTVRSVPSTELLTGLDEYILPGGLCLLLSFSRSGDSSEGVALLQQAQQRYPERVRHIVITCNAAGAIARLPGVLSIVLDDAVNDRGLAMTSSFTNMLIAGQYLAYFDRASAFKAVVEAEFSMAEGLLARAADLSVLLAKKGFSRVCFLGSDALQAAAHESALKVLELNAGKIATLAESFLGLRHGPMSFLNEQTLVCAFLSGDEPRLLYELDLLEEIRDKSLTDSLLIVTPRSSPRIHNVTEHVIDLQAPPDFPDNLRPPVDVILGQILALFLAIENGVRPDTPSTAAISRVVSHVKISSPCCNRPRRDNGGTSDRLENAAGQSGRAARHRHVCFRLGSAAWPRNFRGRRRSICTEKWSDRGFVDGGARPTQRRRNRRKVAGTKPSYRSTLQPAPERRNRTRRADAPP